MKRSADGQAGVWTKDHSARIKQKQIRSADLPHTIGNGIVRSSQCSTRTNAPVEGDLRLARGEEQDTEKDGVEEEESEARTRHPVHDRTGLHRHLPSLVR